MNRRELMLGAAATPLASTAVAHVNLAPLVSDVMTAIVPLTPRHVGVRIEHMQALCEAAGVEWKEAWWK